MASFKDQQPFFKHNFGVQTNLDIHSKLKATFEAKVEVEVFFFIKTILRDNVS